MLGKKGVFLSMIVLLLLSFISSNVLSVECVFEDYFSYANNIFNNSWSRLYTGTPSIINPVAGVLVFPQPLAIHKYDSTPQTNGTFEGTISIRISDIPEVGLKLQMYNLEEQLAQENDFHFGITNDSSMCQNSAPCLSYEPYGVKRNMLNITHEWVDISFTINLDTNEVKFYNSLDFTNNIYNTTSTIRNITTLRFHNFALTGYWDNLGCGGAGTSYCPAPLLFCDNFNYDEPMTDMNWIVYDSGLSVDDEFNPTDDELLLNQSYTYYQPYHETGAFPTSYVTSESTAITESFRSPVFSSEFDLKIYDYTATSLINCFAYQTFSPASESVYSIAICPNESIYYYQSDDYVNLCDSCFTKNIYHTIKINSFFAQEKFNPYNSSIPNNHVSLYVDDVLKGNSFNFINNESYALQKYSIIKNYNSNFSIDNYFVMVGTDKYTDTSIYYYENIFDNVTEESSTLGLDVGLPCITNADCSTNNCEYGSCIRLGGGENCDSNDDCISERCFNGLCTKPSIWKRIDSSKDQQYGDDKNSNNFIALFFMIGLPLLIILSTRSKAGVLGGIVVYFGLSFFFTIVGYLSPFILLGSIVSALILFVFAFVIGGGE